MLLIALIVLVCAGIFVGFSRKPEPGEPDIKRSVRIIYLTYGLLLFVCGCVALDRVGWAVWAACLYLITAAPVLMTALLLRHYSKRQLTRQSRLIVIAAALYWIVLLATGIFAFFILSRQYA